MGPSQAGAQAHPRAAWGHPCPERGRLGEGYPNVRPASQVPHGFWWTFLLVKGGADGPK